MQLLNLPLRKGVEILVLCQSMDHAPALLPGLADLIEDGDLAVAADDETDEGHEDEGARAAHPRAAVD